MKKFTLSIAALALCWITYGQVANQGIPVPFKDDPAQTNQLNTSLKGSGDVFWSTTFNWGDPITKVWAPPTGWVITDLTDLGNFWMWRSPYDTLGGCCTWSGPSKNFKTPLDGYIVVPADEYNRRDGIGTSNPMNTFIITPPIDCSSKTSVTVKFKQLFRLCCGTTIMQMLVTNDGGVHWAAYDCEFGVGNNRVADARYQNVEFNITDVAAGMANVQIKFSISGNTHYYWMIDDLELAEAFNNDLILADYWSDFNGGFDTGIGHINYWPLSQMGMASTVAGNIGDYTFKGAFLNNGNADQENTKLQMTVLRNGTQAFQDVSNGSTIWSLERDTATVNSVFLANDYGDYQFNFTAISDNNEEVPVNNSTKQGFTVTDTLFHRADFTAEAGSNTGGWVGGANAGDMVGVFYDVYQPCEINSITAYISGVTIAQTPTFQYVLQKDMGVDGFVELILSDVIDATLEQRGTYVTLDMQKDGETEFLEPGTYIACVRFWGVAEGDADGTNGMSIGWDMDNSADNYTYMYQAVGGNWYNSGKVNMIGININASGGPTQAPVTFNVDMTRHIASGEFKPGTDFVDVSGSFNNWSGSAHLTDPEADGIYTITLEGMPVGQVIEYKYRINGDWNTSEYPNGGPNRKYTVRYWNVLNNIYNGGVAAGVDQKSLVASFSVYPNPTSGAFTVEISNVVASDLVITLTNIQGQVIYQNTIANVVNYQETIDNKLSKGFYFLTVNNGKGVKVQKVVVQ
ncbi:MAG: T9SS C-terminal target domain-containing protein [Porphyromonadaceae bacterium]|nr:MAG: T9SS C-terminal target domain-containing protein [Porphyromonadaceae bacterium]